MSDLLCLFYAKMQVEVMEKTGSCGWICVCLQWAEEQCEVTAGLGCSQQTAAHLTWPQCQQAVAADHHVCADCTPVGGHSPPLRAQVGNKMVSFACLMAEDLVTSLTFNLILLYTLQVTPISPLQNRYILKSNRPLYMLLCHTLCLAGSEILKNGQFNTFTKWHTIQYYGEYPSGIHFQVWAVCDFPHTWCFPRGEMPLPGGNGDRSLLPAAEDAIVRVWNC